MLGKSALKSEERALSPTIADRYTCWAYTLILGLLAAVNAILFPLWSGFEGGAAPLPSARALLLHLALALGVHQVFLVGRGGKRRWTVVIN